MTIVQLILIAVVAMGAFTATAAQAAEGPFYTVAGKRLGAGESKAMKGGLTSGTKIQLKANSVTLTCTSLKFPEGAKVIGSNGANPGKSEQTIEYEGCTQEGNGKECKVEGARITTEALQTELGYQTKTRTGKVLALLAPISGKTLATVKFEGGKSCTLGESTSLTGTVIGELLSGGKAVEIGSEPAESLSAELNLPSTLIKEGYFETEGTIAAKSASVEGFGGEGGIVHNTTLSLVETAWGLRSSGCGGAAPGPAVIEQPGGPFFVVGFFW